MESKEILKFIEKRIEDTKRIIGDINANIPHAETEAGIVAAFHTKMEMESQISAFREIAAFIKGEEY